MFLMSLTGWSGEFHGEITVLHIEIFFFFWFLWMSLCPNAEMGEAQFPKLFSPGYLLPVKCWYFHTVCLFFQVIYPPFQPLLTKSVLFKPEPFFCLLSLNSCWFLHLPYAMKCAGHMPGKSHRCWSVRSIAWFTILTITHFSLCIST